MRALVLGGAASLAEDEAAILALGFKPDLIVATNHAGRDREGRVDAWCSFHLELFPLWLKERRAHGRPDPESLWTCAPAPKPKSLDLPVRRAPNWRGSSGLLAVTVALELGAERIVLCGVPLTKEGEHYDRPGLWRDAGNYRAGWVANASAMAGKVKSMGGWTAELLGEPGPVWLATAKAAE